MIFQNKTVLVTGGTGTLGKELIRRMMTGEFGVPKKIIVFSRDEDKHYQMKLEWKNMKVATDDVFYHNFEELLDFRIGDVRDFESINRSTKESNIVIHAAALKQVPICEYFPHESVKTNLLGAQNIIRSIIENENCVETVMVVSSDKACKPVNVYGMCKAVQERLVVEANLRCTNAKFLCARYGNVVASRGSVIPLFQEQIKMGGPVTITVQDMTRFWLTIRQATDIVFDALHYGEAGDTFVPDLKSFNIMDLAEIMIGNREIEIQIIGIRPGEKIHELLISEEELSRTVKKRGYFIVRPILPELRPQEVIKPVLNKELSSADYTLNKKDLKTFLEKEGLLEF